MNEPTEIQYLPVTDVEVNAINQLSHIVNDWAEKKGWNQPPSEQSKEINLQLAHVAMAHQGLSDIAERIRKGEKPNLTELMIMSNCRPLMVAQMREMSADQVRDLASLALIHSEVSEGVEGIINDSMDDHMPDTKSINAELADVLIRIFHFCGGHRLINLGEAVRRKMDYNTRRPYRHGKLA